MRNLITKNEMISEVLAYARECVEGATDKSRKQRISEYNNLVNLTSVIDTMDIESVELDFNDMINLGDLVKVAYLKHLHPTQKAFKVSRCDVVKNNNQKTIQVLTCCKSRACKVSSKQVFDYVKYIIYTPTVKAVALVDFDKVVDIPKLSVSSILELANEVKPLVF